MRMMLAAIDHNMHLSRGTKMTENGEECGFFLEVLQEDPEIPCSVGQKGKTLQLFPFHGCKGVEGVHSLSEKWQCV